MAASVSGAMRAGAHRAPETQDWLNRRVFHPLARRVALVCIPLRVSPNMLSFIGFLLILSAAIAYGYLPWPAGFAVGFALHLLWHVFDGADGDLARLTGKSSPLGEVIDGACDYLGHVFLYSLFSILLFPLIGHWAWPLVAAAALSRILQSNFSESQRRIYLWRVHGVPWLQQNAKAVERDSGVVARLFGRFVAAYLALAQKGSPSAREIDALLDSFPDGSAARASARELARDSARGLLPLVLLLGQNLRTILLGLSMAAGSGVWFMVVECTLLNLLFLWAAARERRCSAELLARLRALAERSGRLG